MARAASASYWRHKNQISRAFFCPTTRASRPDPYPPSNEPTLGPVWPKTGVVGRDREVADEVEHMSAADGVAGHHGHDRLGQATDLDLQVEDVQPTDAVGTDIAVVTPDPLVARPSRTPRALRP